MRGRLLDRGRRRVGGACCHGGGVEPELLEELAQGHTGDANLEGPIDKVDEFEAAGVGLLKEELGNGAGIAWQEFAVGSSITCDGGPGEWLAWQRVPAGVKRWVG